MRGFYLAFPIRDAPHRELSWTHYRTLLPADDAKARQWYMNESADQGWSSCALERQTTTLYYEHPLASSNRREVEQEAASNIAPLQQNPREFVRDPVVVEFLGLPGTGKLPESNLEHALLDTCSLKTLCNTS